MTKYAYFVYAFNQDELTRIHSNIPFMLDKKKLIEKTGTNHISEMDVNFKSPYDPPYDNIINKAKRGFFSKSGYILEPGITYKLGFGIIINDKSTKKNDIISDNVRWYSKNGQLETHDLTPLSVEIIEPKKNLGDDDSLIIEVLGHDKGSKVDVCGIYPKMGLLDIFENSGENQFVLKKEYFNNVMDGFKKDKINQIDVNVYDSSTNENQKASTSRKVKYIGKKPEIELSEGKHKDGNVK